jgi:putative ABC transport system ATP-binding protein|tara:strand:+ start:3780 stop:4493 length:714 start_codon:yes stop_codon:yes gene_type:complete
LATGSDIIEARNVFKTYRSRSVVVEALKGVSLSVGSGEMVAIMGPSGSGKTTLLNCVSGLDVVDAGEIIIDNQPLQGMSDDALSEYRARSMGFVFQAFNLLPVLSARENVELPLVLAGVKAGLAREKAMEKLEQVGLADWADHNPNELSGGQIQRVAIARALANDPAIVWADEPTGNLDSENTAQIMDLLCELNEAHGQTFVFVTHQADEVGSRTHRTINMRDGLIEDRAPLTVSGA